MRKNPGKAFLLIALGLLFQQELILQLEEATASHSLRKNHSYSKESLHLPTPLPLTLRLRLLPLLRVLLPLTLAAERELLGISAFYMGALDSVFLIFDIE